MDALGWTDLLVSRVDVPVLVLDDGRGARVTAATTTSALYWRAKTNKPLQIACANESQKTKTDGSGWPLWPGEVPTKRVRNLAAATPRQRRSVGRRALGRGAV